jgi:hypothetical protein
MIQNTSETSETLERYTIPKLEATVQSIANNSNREGGQEKPLEDRDAVLALRDMGVIG